MRAGLRTALVPTPLLLSSREIETMMFMLQISSIPTPGDLVGSTIQSFRLVLIGENLARNQASSIFRVVC
jgi:hypothetical protein